MEKEKNTENTAENTNKANTDKSNQTVIKKKKKKKKVKKPEPTFKEKLSDLWNDKRSYKKRLLISALASGAFVFTFLIFGPFELYLSNMSFFAFSPKDFILPIILSGVIILTALSFLLALLRGKIFNYMGSVLFSLTLAGYVQGNFLNIDHGSLDGKSIPWQEFKAEAFWGFLFWVIMLILPLAIGYFSKKIWRKSITIVCAVLIGAQLVALGTLFIRPTRDHAFSDNSDCGYLSQDKMFTVAPSKNVIVFMLDRFDKDYMEHQLYGDPDSGSDANPAIKEGLKGFTFYTNFTGSYTRTFPSVAYLLTGVHTDYSIPYADYFKKAWSETTFLSDIKNAGYDVRVYSEINYMGGKSEYLSEEVDNVTVPDTKIPPLKILSAMYTLSAYRYLPEFFKPYFHTYTGDFSYSYLYGNEQTGSPYGVNDLHLREKLLSEGVKLDNDSKGTFLFYHLQGSHDPFTMDKDGNKASFSDYFLGRFEQTQGNLKIILEYIDMLKEKGVYDDTTIIITADHGLTGTYQELDKERLLSLLIKPAGADTTLDLETSNKPICQDNLRASISSYFGLECRDGHRTIESIDENEEVVRYFWMNATDAVGLRRDVYLITYEIIGDANDFSNWSIVSKKRIDYPYYDAN